MERLLAEHRFADDSEMGQRLRRRLDRCFITFATMDDLECKLSVIERGPGKNSCKRLVLIAPNLDWLSSLAVRSWLPESIIIVCERNIASRISDTFRRLSTHPDLSGTGNLGDRLAQLAAAAKRELEAAPFRPWTSSLSRRWTLPPKRHLSTLPTRMWATKTSWCSSHSPVPFARGPGKSSFATTPKPR